MRSFAIKTRMSVLIFITSLTTTYAWLGGGHHILTSASVSATPKELPLFFRQAQELIAYRALDPDAFKNKAVPFVKATEGPEHFFDLEIIPDSLIPHARYSYIEYCYKHSIIPERLGFLPYSIEEYTGKLAIAFAQYRMWPKDESNKFACIVYAGYLAHYAEDACQPLHLTIDYDGRIDKGKSPKSGIHDAVDGIIQNCLFTQKELTDSIKSSPFSLNPDSLFLSIMQQIIESRSLVDSIYKYERSFRFDTSGLVPQNIRLFAKDRAREAIQFTASLYATAWKISEKVTFEKWYSDEMKKVSPIVK